MRLKWIFEGRSISYLMKTIDGKFNHFDIDRWSNFIGVSSFAVLSVLLKAPQQYFIHLISLKVQKKKFNEKKNAYIGP